MYHKPIKLWKNLLSAGLDEDGWPWDWTSLSLPPTILSKITHAKIIAKSSGIWAADGALAAIPLLADYLQSPLSITVHTTAHLTDGCTFKPGDVLCQFQGDALSLLALERPFLNLAAYVSGIATATQQLVKIVHRTCPKHPPRVALTRKTLPHYRDLSIYGVLVGGGFPHRVNLASGVLIKENHIAAAGGIAQAIQSARQTSPHGFKIEIEVRSESEFTQALAHQADVILLDNFTPIAVGQALKKLPQQSHLRPVIEVSGGLNETNIAHYALPGVDILSVGSLTHSVCSSDFSFLLENKHLKNKQKTKARK